MSYEPPEYWPDEEPYEWLKSIARWLTTNEGLTGRSRIRSTDDSQIEDRRPGGPYWRPRLDEENPLDFRPYEPRDRFRFPVPQHDTPTPQQQQVLDAAARVAAREAQLETMRRQYEAARQAGQGGGSGGTPPTRGQGGTLPPTRLMGNPSPRSSQRAMFQRMNQRPR